ncbi:MAG TPA: hypothetical protein VJP02_26980 [Candidatus Sulfotelmatobacter sp.]|nr:hypothetical protein [Candidatus Sulfotelmatobacter sp.]
MQVLSEVRGESPLRIKPEAIRYLSSLSHFHAASDESLIRLARRRTRLNVPDRWVAIALILGNNIPIPAGGQGRPRWQIGHATDTATLTALRLIEGGRGQG